ncbi:MAG TPA: universal stress protein, partial [Thermoanaerobaculia bacterium]|nr:universal stress protein [Thermoanaerobaculia bacterium]
MTIVCGTDFSPAAEAACTVAVRLAADHGEPLLLVHALVPMPLPPPPDAPILPIVYDDATERARTALAQLAARLGASGAAVETLVELGDADDVLL